MGHGPIKRLGSVAGKLIPGSIIYALNSQDPLTVLLISDNAVIVNTGEVFLGHRPIRYCGEWSHDFPIDWEDLSSSVPLFKPEEYQEGVVIIAISEDSQNATVETLVGQDEKNQSWLTDDSVLIPYSAQNRLIATGMVYALDIKEEAE